MKFKKTIQKIFYLMNLYPHRILISQDRNIWDEIIGYVKVQKVYREWYKIDQPRLRALKDYHKDKEHCFVIGNGPSLNKIDLKLLKNEITIGSNAIFLLFKKMGFKTTYYTVVDNLIAEDRSVTIKKLDGLIKLFPISRANCLTRDHNSIYFNQRSPKNDMQFSKDFASHAFGGYTVTFTNLQLAYYLGFKKVYLIGVDHSYSIPEEIKIKELRSTPAEITSLCNDPNHFSPDYFGKGYRWHDPRPSLHKMEAAYKKAKEAYEADGRNIYNATVGGKLNIFERVDYSSLFWR